MNDGSEKPNIKKGIKDFTSHEYNPSAAKNNVQGLYLGVGQFSKVYVSEETGEVIDDGVDRTDKQQISDNHQYVKLYKDAQVDIMKLNSAGIAVLSYIFSTLKKWQDEVLIDAKRFGAYYNSIPEFAESSAKMVCYRGVVNLLQHELIYRKVGEGVYYINVNKFFNGTRLRFSWIRDIQKRLDGGEHVKLEELFLGGAEGLKNAMISKNRIKSRA